MTMTQNAYSPAGVTPRAYQCTAHMPADSAIRRAWEQWKAGDTPGLCKHAPAETEMHAIVVMDPPDAHRDLRCGKCFDKVRRGYVRGLPFESCDACDALGPTQTYRLTANMLFTTTDASYGDVSTVHITGWMQVCADCRAEACPPGHHDDF